MLLRFSSLGSITAFFVSLACLVWVWRETAKPLPALTLRPIRGAALDAPLEGQWNMHPAGASREAPLEIPDTGAVSIELAHLAFDDYDPPELRGANAEALGPKAFPETIEKLHGREIEIEGFPLIMEFGDEGAQELLLTRFPPGCCFGTVPVMDEWISVSVGEGDVDPGTGYDPIRMRGRFFAGEVLDDNGFVESLYRLEGAQLAD